MGLPKANQLAQCIDPETGSLSCPLYSGHLLKRGSNKRWQSRLFIFDGSVLVCVGKKSRAPTITTYDPYVSSPFAPSCPPHPLNPSTKWSISIASVTDIKLLPLSKSYFCFWANDACKELSIQTSDGQCQVLRASKDVDLERWYFVLSKIWEYQQQLRRSDAPENSPYAARHLSAHEQSAQLFQKYLQKHYPYDIQEQLRHGLQQQQHEPISPLHRLSPSQKRPREGPVPSQLPHFSRVSTFFSQKLDGPLPEVDEDGVRTRVNPLLLESQSASGEEHRPHARQSSWSHQQQFQGATPTPMAAGIRQDNKESYRASSASVIQRYFCPVGSMMEPGKAAVIDQWRRSLFSPEALPEVLEPPATLLPGPQNSPESTLPCTNSRDLESTLMPSPAEHHYGHTDPRKSSTVQVPSGTGLMKPRAVKNSVSSKDSEPIQSKDPYSRGGQGSDQRTLSSLRLSRHSQLDLPSLLQKECEGAPLRRYDVSCGRDDTNTDLAAKEEDDELPLGLLQVNRHSRWFNTQLSTDDGASEAQNDSHVNLGIVQHTLLPPEPITPKHGPVPDTSPYTKNSISNSNRSSPPARPTRPPGDLLSTLDGPNDSTSWTVPFANGRSSSSSLAPSPATYKLHQPHQPSHSGPIPAMSNVGQARVYYLTSPFPNLSGDIKQMHGRSNVEDEQDEEDEDEPLAVTQSRQQSTKFLQQLQGPFSQPRINPLRPSSFAAFRNNRSSAGLMAKSYSSRLHTHEQATPPASNESASYF